MNDQATVTHLPLHRLQESKTSPRTTFAKLDELIASIKEKGVLVPLLVRPPAHGVEGYEIVFGARRYRAAKLAKLATVPVEVKTIADDEVEELQHIENTQREDLTPLEEADSLFALAKRMPLEDVARRVGKPIAHVRGRLILAGLTANARKALDGGKITAEHAYRIGRLPRSVQDKALEYVTKLLEDYTYEARDSKGHFKNVTPDSAAAPVLPLAELTRELRERFLRRLTTATFSTTDVLLVGKAGACTTCPKRTGAQRELFDAAEIPEDDVCTDPSCWSQKEQADFASRADQARANPDGYVRIIPEKKAAQLFQHRGGRGPTEELAYDAPFKRLDDTITHPTTYRDISIKALLAKEEKPPTVHVARTPSGAVVELVDKSVVDAACRKLETASRSSSGVGRTPSERESPKSKAKRKALEHSFTAAVEEALGQVVAAVETGKAGQSVEFWRSLAGLVLCGLWGEHAQRIVKRRALRTPDADKKIGDLELLVRASRSMRLEQLRSLVVEVVIRRDTEFPRDDGDLGSFAKTELGVLFGDVDVDLKKLADRHKRETLKGLEAHDRDKKTKAVKKAKRSK